MSGKSDTNEPTAQDLYGETLLDDAALDGKVNARKKTVGIKFEVMVAVVQLIGVAVLIGVTASHKSEEPPAHKAPQYSYTCDHPIYCQGPLLKAIELAEPPVFPDSKTFVDMPMKHAPAVILQKYTKLQTDMEAGADVNLTAFVLENFDPAGSEVVQDFPSDFSASPAFLSGIADPDMREFGKQVNGIWRKLVRRFNTSQYCKECYSSLTLPHSFVVPGGRFREFYYWDSFWILQGLLVSGMNTTGLNIVRNMAYLIKEFGMMPNGARCYYLDRSQPPVLAQMVRTLLNETGNDPAVLAIVMDEVLPSLMIEYDFWMKTNHAVKVQSPASNKNYTLNRYYADVEMPRPESYREDYDTLKKTPWRTPRDLLSNIAAAAEAGWDFSSRWFSHSMVNMSSARTTFIVPVDLNAIMLANEEFLTDLVKMPGSNYADRAAGFKTAADARREAIFDLLWDANKCEYRDFDMGLRRSQSNFYVSSFVPLWVPSLAAKVKSMKCIAERTESDFQLRIGGIPTSVINSGQQWDYPNAWPPSQWFAIRGLRNLDTAASRSTADKLTTRFISSNYCGFQKSRAMFEKYTVERWGSSGGGGEYVPQDGFGWTNGVALGILREHGATLVAPTELECNTTMWN